MMKERLRFLLLALLAAVLFFSCASDDAADEPLSDAEAVPVVEAMACVEEEPADEPLLEAVPDEMLAEETLPDEEEPAGTFFEDEFIPVEDAVTFVLDVTSYYDGFAISEDDFVAVVEESDVQDEPAAEPEELPELEELPEPEELPVPEKEPEMQPLSVPSPREDMKKPVVVISEEAAQSASDGEKELALSELESILSAIPEPEEPPKPAPSRSVTIHKNDMVEVPYQGNWWVYLGDANNSNALVFSGRNYVSDKTVFTLRAVKEGQALLHFYKQDIIGGVMVDDYLEVIVEENLTASTKITLDEFIISQLKPLPPDAYESEMESVTEREEEPQTVPVSAEKAAVAEQAPSAFQGISIEEEADIVSEPAEVSNEETMLSTAPDEELFKRAQEMEASDIEGALKLYQQLVSNYPTSPYWNQANKRITYINRFYFFKR